MPGLQPDASTPLLGRFMLWATWANDVEHAADPFKCWGSRGRGFKSRRPDRDKAMISGNAVMAFIFVYGI
jgi:hypothetical protein